MKRTDLLRQIKTRASEHGKECHLLRQGGGHEIWSVNGKSVPIPRHREVNDYTAKEILKQVEAALG